MSDPPKVYHKDYSAISLVIDYKDTENQVTTAAGNGEIVICEIQNCPTTLEASKLISSEAFRSKFPNFLVFRLKINEKLVGKDAEPPKRTEFDAREKVVVSFESNQSFDKIIWWKNEKSRNFSELRLTDNNPSISITNYALNFIIETIKDGGSVTTFDSSPISVVNICDAGRVNLLFNAVLDNNIAIVRELLKLPFKTNEPILFQDASGPVYAQTMIEYVWKKRHLDTTADMMYELLNANSKFPPSFKGDLVGGKMTTLLAISKDMHDAIKANDKDKVVEILNQHPHFRYFLSEINESAANIALQCDNYDLYELLASHQVTLIEGEQIKDMPKSTHEKLTNIHSNLSRSFANRHLMRLIARSVSFHGDRMPEEHTRFVEETFKAINSVPEVEAILKVVATAKDAKIHFDFEDTTVKRMDTSDTGSNGLFNCTKLHVHIAGKMLVSKGLKDHGDGVVSHEFSHFSLHLVFYNDREPYAADDAVNKKLYQAIVKSYQERKHEEIIVGSVFTQYGPAAWGRELIVRVPHMLVAYRNDKEKLRKLKEDYSELYAYYSKVVTPAMDNAVSVLEQLSNELAEVTFSELTAPLQAAIRKRSVMFQGNMVDFNSITGNLDSLVYSKLSSQQIRQMLSASPLEIGRMQHDMNKNYSERKFIASSFEGDIWKVNFTENAYELTPQALNVTEDYKTVLKGVRESRLFLLADHAGAGKTTTLKFIYSRLKMTMPRVWVVYVDLHIHIKTFKEREEHLKTDSSLKMVITILNEITSPPLNPLESAIFESLVMTDKVIVLFDGVDEISPKFSEFFFKMVDIIRDNTKIMQWIATRSQDVDDLGKRFNQKVYKLLPFNYDQTEQFVRTVLASKQIVDELQQKHAVDEVSKVTKKIKLMENPLMLTILTELHIAGRLKGVNYNRYSIFEAIISVKLDILAEEKGSISNRDSIVDSKATLYEIFEVYAVETNFEDEFQDFTTEAFLSSSESIDFCTFIKQLRELGLMRKWYRKFTRLNWTSSAIARSGLLIVNKFKSAGELPSFAHSTFGEFFVAKFIIDSIVDLLEDYNTLVIEERQLRIAFITFVIVKQCQKRSEYELIWNFVCDYFGTDQHIIEISKPFMEIVESGMMQKLVLKMMSRHKREQIAKFTNILLNLSKYLTKCRHLEVIEKTDFEGRYHDIFKTLLDNKPRTPFQLLFAKYHEDYDGNFLYEILDFFHLLTSNGCLHLTGYGDASFDSLSIDDDFIIKCNDGVNLQLSALDGAAVDEAEVRHYKSLSLLLTFVLNSRDFPADDLENFVSFNLRDILRFALRSRSLADKLFQVLKTVFGSSKMKVAEAIGTILNDHIVADFPPALAENLNYFLEGLEELLESQEGAVKRALSHQFHYSNIMTLAINHNVESLKAFCRKYFGPSEIVKLMHTQATQSMNYFLNSAEAIKNFDDYCSAISGYPKIFQLYLNSCTDFHIILGLVDNFKQVFGLKWANYTGYTVRGNSRVLIDEEIDERAASSFVINEQIPLFQRHAIRKQRQLFGNFLRLFQLFDILEIPTEHSINFFDHNFRDILKYTLDFHEKARDTLQVLKKHFENSKSRFVELIVRELRYVILNDSHFIASEGNLPPFDYFLQEVEDYLGHDRELMRNILLIDYPYSHPLIYVINFDLEISKNMHLKCLEVDEIRRIFMLKTCETIRYIRSLNGAKFQSLLNTLYPPEPIMKFTSCFLPGAVQSISNENRDGRKRFGIYAEIIFLILRVIEEGKVPMDELEEFYERNMKCILLAAFRSTIITSKLFKSFRNHFGDEREKVANFLAKGIKHTDILSTSKANIETTVECAVQVERFFTQFHDFFDANEAAKRVFVSSDYKIILVQSIYFNFITLINMYVDICSPAEILDIFATDLRSIEFFGESDNIKPFFLRTFAFNFGEEILIEWLKGTMLKTISKNISISPSNYVNALKKFQASLFAVCEELGMSSEDISLYSAEFSTTGSIRTFTHHSLMR